MLTSLIALAFQAAAAPPAPKAADPLPADWKPIPAAELLVMKLADERQVVIRLAPRYAPVHVANIRKLASARWWDGETIYRVHDNYVVQWGDATEKKALPAGVIAQPPAEYDWPRYDAVTRLTRIDPYSTSTGHSADGWPLATNGMVAWLPHCYGMVGVARDLKPSTGSGGDLYAVIGHAPRHLDRNIAIVGRVLEGIEHLSSLPRGTEGGLGLYKEASQRVPIISVRLASELPEASQPRFEYRAANNARFAAWVKARENREPPFFELPAGGSDICNAMPPVRRAS
ncbi:peptidylprolyl isomerase [Sphingomonas turrisvirgatae]|uniref:peptidylprolyl isomerase n=1 Tax=Sphingomonas turrisvirgatae TaxID=1888892 RepID=A0A1E3M310_9SPHN|nr:peptidylprolyl isomerase [Sphingomonas turrisvirgatae]ODP39755.1 peptidylprolyl isomerase [Sphingomonas turrisvirgatae]